jgi:Tol biopolymer transport system component
MRTGMLVGALALAALGHGGGALAQVFGGGTFPPPLNPEVASRGNDQGLLGANDAALSADAVYLAFASTVSGNGLVLRDRLARTTLRIDRVNGSSTPANGASGNPAFDPNNEPNLVFDSFASNLDGHGPHAGRDVFYAELQGNGYLITRLSLDSNGDEIAGVVDCFDPTVGGESVVFVCRFADNTRRLYRKNRTTGVLSAVGLNMGGGVTAGTQTDRPVLDSQGRYLAFISDAPDLVAGDTNGLPDAFVQDLVGSTLQRVSVRADGSQISGGFDGVTAIDLACGEFDGPARSIAFVHDANNIAGSDSNNLADVFVAHCRTPGGTVLASKNAAGNAVSGESGEPSLVGGGYSVLFSSNAALLAGTDFTGGRDVYQSFVTVGQPTSPSLLLKHNPAQLDGLDFDSFALAPLADAFGNHAVMRAAGGAVGDQLLGVRLRDTVDDSTLDVTAFGFANTEAAAISADGRMQVFVSDSGGFDRGWFGVDNDSVGDVFVFDASATCVEQLSMGDLGFNGGNCPGSKSPKPQSVRKGGACTAPEICAPVIEPSLDAGGAKVVFVAPDAAVPKFANETQKARVQRRKAGTLAVALRNIQTGRLFRIGTGTLAGSGSKPQLAPDGLSVSWVSSESLTMDDTRPGNDVFRQALTGSGAPIGPPVCVSCLDENGLPAPDGDVGSPTVSADGTRIAFVAPNGSGGTDLVLRNIQTGRTQRLATGGLPLAQRAAGEPSMDHAGRRIAFRSDASLAPGDSNNRPDIYLIDTTTGRLDLVSTTSSTGFGGNGDSFQPSLSGDGRSLAFVSEADNFTDPLDNYGDRNGVADVIIKRLDSSNPADGAFASLYRTRLHGTSLGDSLHPRLSYSGSSLIYDSTAANMLDESVDANASRDVFRRAVRPPGEVLFLHSFE